MFSLRRWRNTRGFGVHSPFGYDIVTRVVRPGRGYSYYGYAAIDAACEQDGCSMKTGKQAKMLLRLAAMLNIDSAFLPTGVHPAFHSALKAANREMRIERRLKNASACRMLCAKGDYIPLETIKRHLSASGNVVALLDVPEGWIEDIYNSMENGIMVKGKKNAFFIARQTMQKVGYQMTI